MNALISVPNQKIEYCDNNMDFSVIIWPKIIN